MRRRRNVEQGFYADGVFHPIRSSSDYNPKRGGDMAGRTMSEYARRGRKNPGTKAERAVRAQKASATRRVAVALAKYLKQQNPSVKLAGAQVEHLKGGVLKITPIKANAGGRAKPFAVVAYNVYGDMRQTVVSRHQSLASAEKAISRYERSRGRRVKGGDTASKGERYDIKEVAR